MRIETDISIQDAASPDLTGFTNIRAWIHRHIIPQSNASTNHGIGTNVDACSQGDIRINNGTGINTPCGRGLGEKVFKQVNESQIGVGDTDGRAINWDVWRYQDSRSI